MTMEAYEVSCLRSEAAAFEEECKVWCTQCDNTLGDGRSIINGVCLACEPWPRDSDAQCTVCGNAVDEVKHVFQNHWACAWCVDEIKARLK